MFCVGVRPYRCDQCDKAFTQRCSLESHTRKVHGVELQFAYKQRRPKTYVCEECGHTSAQPQLHYLHLRQLHPYSPALARSHDKRLFKFSAESSLLLPPTDWKMNEMSSLEVELTTLATFFILWPRPLTYDLDVCTWPWRCQHDPHSVANIYLRGYLVQ